MIDFVEGVEYICSNPKEEVRKMAWEHLHCFVDNRPNKSQEKFNEEIEEELTNCEDEGWELVTVTPEIYAGETMGLHLFFKREAD